MALSLKDAYCDVSFLLLILAWRVTWVVATPVALVLPVPGKAHLAVQPEGIELLNSLEGPVAPVVVIGPYRSGKSFTLNQLLGVPCDQGFGVGHTRDTQTKGIWVWSQPVLKSLPGGGHASILYIDTEGFESTGKSNSYDDRVFAVSAVLSSLLIYNLPETIRESDISKLSFAVELAQGLYDRFSATESATPAGDSATSAAKTPKARAGSFQPGSMLWLIQRDFLQGKSASEVVAQALALVPNPEHDQDIHQLNTVRQSLAVIASNSTGYSLAQPHLERTRLCELPDSELDPKYLQQRNGLRTLVQDMVQPKSIAGRPYSGRELAALLQQLVTALNSQEIPNVASMLEVFNRDLVSKCVRQYRAALEALALPMEEGRLTRRELEAKADAVKLFESSFVGSKRSSELEQELMQALQREFHVKRTENLAESNTLCSSLEAKCEADLDELQGMTLPSVRKFNITFKACQAAFERRCVGPAKAGYADRLTKAFLRSEGQFSKSYNDRLYSGMTFISLGLAVLFRFVVRLRLLEGASWAAFMFLELWPHLHVGPGSMYDAQWWRIAVRTWELLMFVLFGFRGAWVVWILAVAAAFAYKTCKRRYLAGFRLGKRTKSGGHGYVRSTRDLEV